MTGMYAVSLGAQNHRTHAKDKLPLPNGVKPLTQWLRGAGYFTANIVHLPAACGFKGSGKTDWNFVHNGKAFDSENWNDLKKHQPFYAQININDTHRDYQSPKRADPAKVEFPPFCPDHPITRNDMAKYLDAVSEMDSKFRRQRPLDGARQTILLRGRFSSPAPHPLAEKLSRATADQARHRGRPSARRH
jgi:hypothetical protein